jgi:hypothetical protein
MEKHTKYMWFIILLIIAISVFIFRHIESSGITVHDGPSKQKLDLSILIVAPIVIFFAILNSHMSNVVYKYKFDEKITNQDVFIYTLVVLVGFGVMGYGNLDYADNRIISFGNRGYGYYTDYGHSLGILNYKRFFIGINILTVG